MSLTTSFFLGPTLAGSKSVSSARLSQFHSLAVNLSLLQKLLLQWEWAWSPLLLGPWPAVEFCMHDQDCTASWAAGRPWAGKGNENGQGSAHLGCINGHVVEQALWGGLERGALELCVSHHLVETWFVLQTFVCMIYTSSNSSLTALPSNDSIAFSIYIFFFLTLLSLFNFL